jgi:hypothetical protein
MKMIKRIINLHNNIVAYKVKIKIYTNLIETLEDSSTEQLESSTNVIVNFLNYIYGEIQTIKLSLNENSLNINNVNKIINDIRNLHTKIQKNILLKENVKDFNDIIENIIITLDVIMETKLYI